MLALLALEWHTSVLRINQHMTFEVPSFADSKDMIKGKI